MHSLLAPHPQDLKSPDNRTRRSHGVDMIFAGVEDE